MKVFFSVSPKGFCDLVQFHRLCAERKSFELRRNEEAIIPGCENERHVQFLKPLSHGEDELVSEMDVQNGSVNGLRRDESHGFVYGCRRSDNRRIQIEQRPAHLVGKEILVLDHKDAFARVEPEKCRIDLQLPLSVFEPTE